MNKSHLPLWKQLNIAASISFWSVCYLRPKMTKTTSITTIVYNSRLLLNIKKYVGSHCVHGWSSNSMVAFLCSPDSFHNRLPPPAVLRKLSISKNSNWSNRMRIVYISKFIILICFFEKKIHQLLFFFSKNPGAELLNIFKYVIIRIYLF